MTNHEFDVAVVGAGSGGLGAAIAAARLGRSVALIEKADRVGGTAVRGGVHCWEPGCGGTGIPFDIYRRLRCIPGAVGIYSIGRHFVWQEADAPDRFPGGEQVIDPARHYIDSLRRYGAEGLDNEALARERWHGVPFEPDAYCDVVEKMLAGTARCTLMKETAFTGVEVRDGRILGLELDNGSVIKASAYIDSTADGLLCLACGCAARVGQEARETFGEPDAPPEPAGHINAVSLIFRITRTDPPGVEPLPPGIASECWWAPRFSGFCCNEYPNGDRNMNMLPTMEGRDFLSRPYPDAYEECRRRILAAWHHTQVNFPEFRRFRISWIAPALGIRETRRIVGEYTLTQHDLLAGIARQKHPDIIALADHSMDVHGAGRRGRGNGQLLQPYGIPYRCLIPKGFQNLLIACRAASFSAIAASSCRLSRTMMQIGQAAGTAAALARKLAVGLPDVPLDRLRGVLRNQNVQLEWPLPEHLHEYLVK